MPSGSWIAVLATCFAAAACSPNARIIGADFASVKAIATTGNLRLISERNRGPLVPPVVCTEPSPDYIAALTTKFNAQATITPPTGQMGGSGGLSGEASENIISGLGRTAGVVALRDGLYAACQSYANGLIGQDAYAIILSQYGSLLVELVGGDDDRPILGPDGKPLAGTGGGTRVTVQRNPLLSAIVIACISGQDQTRIPAGPSNELLNPRFCGAVLRDAVRYAMQTRRG